MKSFLRMLILTFMFSVASIVFANDHSHLVEEIKPEYPGYMYKPKGVAKAPVLLLLHGSKGGSGVFWYSKNKPPFGADALVPKLARYYASRGFITYAYCYFDCRHLLGFNNYPPDELAEIDVSQVISAYKWLKTNYSSNGKAGIYGVSRGAELSLILANAIKEESLEMSPQIVISLSPPDVVAGSFSKKNAEAIIAGEKPDFSDSLGTPAWKLNSKKYQSKQKINISSYVHPLLITYFTSDPVWGLGIDPKNLFLDVQHSKKTKLISFNDTTTISDLGFTQSDINFVQFNKSGHVYDKSGTDEFKFQVKAINNAMDYYLK